MSVTGEPSSPPERFGPSIIDYMAGATAMVGLLACLLSAQRTAKGCDGWLYVMCMSDKFWLELLKALEREALAADAPFADGNTRHRHRQALTAALDPIFRQRTTGVWLERLAGACLVAPVYDVAQALDSPFVAASGMIRDVAHPKQDLHLLTSLIKIDGERAELAAAPAFGADNARLLRSR